MRKLRPRELKGSAQVHTLGRRPPQLPQDPAVLTHPVSSSARVRVWPPRTSRAVSRLRRFAHMNQNSLSASYPCRPAAWLQSASSPDSPSLGPVSLRPSYWVMGSVVSPSQGLQAWLDSSARGGAPEGEGKGSLAFISLGLSKASAPNSGPNYPYRMTRQITCVPQEMQLPCSTSPGPAVKEITEK